MASGNGEMLFIRFLFFWYRINFNFATKARKLFFRVLSLSLSCDSLNCRHSDAAADVAVAVYRTFLAFALHTLGRAQKIPLEARFERDSRR